MRFPVIARKFPVPSLREYAKIIEQCQHVTGKFEARLGCFCKNSQFFPCLTGKSPETDSPETASTTTLFPGNPGPNHGSALTPQFRGLWQYPGCSETAAERRKGGKCRKVSGDPFQGPNHGDFLRKFSLKFEATFAELPSHWEEGRAF